MARRSSWGKIWTRIQSGGVVIGRGRLLAHLERTPGEKIVGNKKLRIVGAPHRKAFAAGTR
jgi:hypothetical protein